MSFHIDLPPEAVGKPLEIGGSYVLRLQAEDQSDFATNDPLYHDKRFERNLSVHLSSRTLVFEKCDIDLFCRGIISAASVEVSFTVGTGKQEFFATIFAMPEHEAIQAFRFMISE